MMTTRLLRRSMLLVLLCFVTFVDLEAQTVDLSDGLVVYYPMEGDMNDASGNGYHGTTSNNSGSWDRFGRVSRFGFKFQSGDDYTGDMLIASSDPALRPTTYTLNIWFSYYDIEENGPFTGGSLVEGGSLFRIGILEDGQGISYKVVDSEGTVTTLYGQGIRRYSLPLWDIYLDDSEHEGTLFGYGSAWSMATLTYDGTYLRAYLNGKLESQTVLAHPPQETNEGIYIGRGYEGSADDMRIYDRALNEEEIVALYESFLYPEFSADVQNGEKNLTVNFTDNSTSEGPISSWEWNFGDGSISYEQNPTHVYTEPGIYYVTLIVGMGDKKRHLTKRAFISVRPAAKPTAAITDAEYFFDEDPGVGNGTAIALSGGTTAAAFEEFTVDASQLSPGFHFLHVRSKSNNGMWSAAHRSVFYVQEVQPELPAQANQVIAAEYYFNEDPGVGKGTPIDLTAAATVDELFEMDVTGLEPGFHRAFIRVKNDKGLWSEGQAANIYVQETHPALPAEATKIVAAEYYFDTDPGAGKGTSIDLSATDAEIQEQIQASAAGLALGEHSLVVRVKNDKGLWSTAQSKLFQVSNTSAELQVKRFELNPAVAEPNTKVQTTLELENLGDADVENAFKVQYYFSEDETLDRNDNLLFTHSVTEVIAASGSLVIERELQMPDALAKGTYYLLADLDVEELVFEADETNNQGSVALNINNAPKIAAQNFRLEENSANATVVGMVTASDPDGDPLSFSIAAANEGGTFAIDAATGELTIADNTILDFEINPEFTLTVEVSDEEMLASAVVTVSLSNINEEPVIEDQSFTVVENSSIGTAVGTVEATDPDGDDLSFAITAGNESGVFALDEATGALTVADNTALDYEASPEFVLTIEVSDGDMLSSAAVTILLTDEDDENTTPVIEDQSFTIAENSRVGMLVGEVAARDEDGDALSFSITEGNGSGAFAIDGATGELTIASTEALDYETTPEFILAVEVSDGELTASAAVTVSLTDVDEEGNTAPVIEEQSFTIAEDSENGSLVGAITASDEDGDALSYSIREGNEAGAFALDAGTGELTVADHTALDYAVTPQFNLMVEVSDGRGGAASAAVIIQVSEAGEGGNKAPVLEDQSFLIAENSEAGTIVGKVTAEDPEGEVLNFAIVEGNTGEAFAINEGTGQLIVNNAAALDYETTPFFALTIEVSDGEMTSSAIITVELIDEEEQVTGVEDELKSAVLLYPNPAGDYLQVELPARLQNASLSLYSLKGEKLGEYSVDDFHKEIDLRSMKTGRYFLQIKKEDVVLYFKVIKAE